MNNNTQTQPRKVEGWTFSTFAKHLSPSPHFNTLQGLVNGHHALVSDGGRDKKIMPFDALEWFTNEFNQYFVNDEGLNKCIQSFDESDRTRLERELNKSEQERLSLERLLNESEQGLNETKKSLKTACDSFDRKAADSEKIEQQLNEVTKKLNESERQKENALRLLNEKTKRENAHFTDYLKSSEFFLAMVLLFQVAQIPITSYAVGMALPDTWHNWFSWIIAVLFGIGLELSTLVLVINGRWKVALVSGFTTLVVSGYTFNWLQNGLSLIVERVDFWANSFTYASVSILIVTLIFAFSKLSDKK